MNDNDYEDIFPNLKEDIREHNHNMTYDHIPFGGKQYAKKTCNICGLIDIQPNMVRQKKKVKTGKGRDSLGAGTIAGIFLENKQSAKRLRKVLWANNNREYTSYREVWMCHECAGQKNPGAPTLMQSLAKWFEPPEKTRGDVVLEFLAKCFGILFLVAMILIYTAIGFTLFLDWLGFYEAV